jgi:hypothetical protein
MPPPRCHDQRESEHLLNYRLHGLVQCFLRVVEVDFANAFPAAPNLKLTELGGSTAILLMQSL